MWFYPISNFDVFFSFQLSRKLLRRLLPIWEPMLCRRTQMPKRRKLSCTRVRRSGSNFQMWMPHRVHRFILWDRGKLEAAFLSYRFFSLNFLVKMKLSTNDDSIVFNLGKRKRMCSRYQPLCQWSHLYPKRILIWLQMCLCPRMER